MSCVTPLGRMPGSSCLLPSRLALSPGPPLAHGTLCPLAEISHSREHVCSVLSPVSSSESPHLGLVLGTSAHLPNLLGLSNFSLGMSFPSTLYHSREPRNHLSFFLYSATQSC